MPRQLPFRRARNRISFFNILKPRSFGRGFYICGMTWTYFNILSILFAASLTSAPPAIKAPAGTASVPGARNLFLDKAELTNIGWMEYLYYLKTEEGENSSSYKEAIPDTIIWKLSYDAPFFKSKKYNEWPVIGITYQQAVKYCNWRSKVVSQKERRKVVYSLPSMMAYKLASHDSSPNKVAEGLYATSIGFRTFLGLCENADEMTEQEGLAIMGSSRTNCLDTLSYYAPTASLSFRCMASVN